ncbi:MAG: hypothetical protein ACI9MC_002540 [Kiritimatiellia bacterium]|jgi:hypothetical protein
MWIYILSSLFQPALASDIVIEAEVPVEVAIDGHPMAQVFYAATMRFTATEGEHTVTLIERGNPSKLVVQVPKEGAVRVVVARTGVSTATVNSDPTADIATVDLRLMGNEGVRVTLDGHRYTLASGDQKQLELSRGWHKMDVRSYSGTVIYASGNLEVAGTGDVIVHLSAGRGPEVTGTTGRWRSGER